MEFDSQRVWANARNATTEDLLDRATVFRSALEPAALPIILKELKSRGVSAEAVVEHEEARGEVVYDATGIARKCFDCTKPAVVCEWGWHRLFDKLPLFPRVFFRCQEHRRQPTDQQSVADKARSPDAS